MFTIKAQLVAKEIDLLNYTTVVFKSIEPAPFGYNYLMCIIYPNWESRIPEIGETGYLNYKECKAGDTWYDNQTGKFIPYKFNNLQFIKFVEEKDNLKKDIII